MEDRGGPAAAAAAAVLTAQKGLVAMLEVLKGPIGGDTGGCVGSAAVTRPLAPHSCCGLSGV